MMTTISPSRPRPGLAARRAGYLIAAVINTLLLYAINVWPGWQEVPFLSEDTPRVLGLVNLSLAVGIAANLVYVCSDPPWLKALGDLVTAGIGLAVLIRIWQVFPFDVEGYSVDWGLIIRITLVVAMVAAAIGVAVPGSVLVRRLAEQRGTGGRGSTRSGA